MKAPKSFFRFIQEQLAICKTRGVIPYGLVLSASDAAGLREEYIGHSDYGMVRALTGSDPWPLDGIPEEIFGLVVMRGPHTGLLVPLKPPNVFFEIPAGIPEGF